MSCNAWNHPPNCTCGWGGVFYGLGVRTERYYWQVSDSYTNPNATCPTCRARVFYYESPFGGKVYFDHMGPPWPKHPCMDVHQERMRMELRNVQTHSTRKLQLPKIQIEDGWMPVYCSDVKSSTELSGCVVLSLFETENRKFLFIDYPREKIDVRSPILIRRVKHAAHYEISTLSLRDSSPSELRLLAFTSISELKRFSTELLAVKEPRANIHSLSETFRKVDEDPQPVKKKIKYDPNREVKVTVIGRRAKVVDEETGEEKIRLEENKLGEQALNSAKAKRREDVIKKREDRKSKREAREQEEKNKAKPRFQTALELAFAKVEVNRSKG